jgi:hypothetical protein
MIHVSRLCRVPGIFAAMDPSSPSYIAAAQALSVIRSGCRIFVHGSAATPTYLVRALAAESHRLTDVEVVCISVLGDFPIAAPEQSGSFRINSFFV